MLNALSHLWCWTLYRTYDVETYHTVFCFCFRSKQPFFVSDHMISLETAFFHIFASVFVQNSIFSYLITWFRSKQPFSTSLLSLHLIISIYIQYSTKSIWISARNVMNNDDYFWFWIFDFFIFFIFLIFEFWSWY